MVHTCNLTTLEAEVGGSLQPRRSRLQWTVIVTLHSSLGNKVREILNKKKKRNLQKEKYIITINKFVKVTT